MNPVCRRLAPIVLAALVAPAAHTLAAEPATAKPPPAAKPAGKLMSKDELRVCLDERDQRQAQRARLQADITASDAQRAELNRRSADIAQRRAALDPANPAAAEVLQADIVKQDEQVDRYNQQLRTLVSASEAFESSRADYIQRCETRPYDERDEIAILRERRNAAKAPAKK